jgi:hypothetical protein
MMNSLKNEQNKDVWLKKMIDRNIVLMAVVVAVVMVVIPVKRQSWLCQSFHS